ncbi:MAG: peptidase M64 [Prevotella sp.]|nr:peptidase M64 [Prevotella sp.]
MRKAFFILLCMAVSSIAHAQSFNRYFTDNTLRIDYTFSGNAQRQDIYVDKLNVSPRWYGKRQRLAELPVEGNGQITVRDHRTGLVVYRNSFSTLFQEWLSYDEAKTAKKSFENVFLVPMPRDTVDVTIDLRNNRRQIMATMTHTVVPNDILIHHIGERNVTPYVTLQQAADTARCIHIAYVAEGYQESEMQTFIDDAHAAMEALFAHEPFKSLRERFHIVAVKSPSKDSGTSEPGNGIWKQTALGSHFDTFYSDRYLTTLNLKALHDWLAGIPYEHIIVLVNTEKYGGGGILNSYNLSMTHHRMFKPVVVHEFGHSFAGLADEYAYEQEAIPMYPSDIEPWEPNITTQTNFGKKWKDMVGKVEGVGLYEGAGYSLKGVYRPEQDCRMRTNENPTFCHVCEKAIRQIIDFYTR